jgi:hypothetical protein
MTASPVSKSRIVKADGDAKFPDSPSSTYTIMRVGTIYGTIRLSGQICHAEHFVMSDLDLVNWTMREAKQLGPERHMHGENEATPSLDNLLEVLEGERGKPEMGGNRAVSIRSVQVAFSEPVPPRSDTSETPQPGIAADQRTFPNVPPPVPAGFLAMRISSAQPMSPLLKALLEPDIYTTPADRERAIMLRWVLRDIKADRLKLSPADQRDLRDLTDMGLVEIRNNTPVLTTAGTDAIA